MKSLGFAIVCTLCALAFSSSSFAEELRFDSFQRGDREVGVFAGYGVNHRFPEATKDRYNYDILALRYAVFTSPSTQMALDLSTDIGERENADDNLAVGVTGSYRKYFLIRGRTAVAYDFSFGLSHLKSRVPELGTKTNFNEQIGIILQRGIGHDAALNLKYTFSHTSNAGIKLPNIGINASIISLGYSYYR